MLIDRAVLRQKRYVPLPLPVPPSPAKGSLGHLPCTGTEPDWLHCVHPPMACTDGCRSPLLSKKKGAPLKTTSTGRTRRLTNPLHLQVPSHSHCIPPPSTSTSLLSDLLSRGSASSYPEKLSNLSLSSVNTPHKPKPESEFCRQNEPSSEEQDRRLGTLAPATPSFLPNGPHLDDEARDCITTHTHGHSMSRSG